MVEQDKENSSGLSAAGLPSGGPFTEKQLKLFVHKIFFGPIELNPYSEVVLKWTDDPAVSGKVSFTTLHGNDRTICNINFEYIEGCFGFISGTNSDHHRNAFILKFRDPGPSLMTKRIATRKMQEQMNQYQLASNKEPLQFLTIILNEAVTSNGRGVAEDERNIGYTTSDLRAYLLNNAHHKFREDWKLRFLKVRGRHSNEDFCFYDEINQENFAKFLKTVGIRNERSRNQNVTYVGVMPEHNKFFELRNSISQPSSSTEAVEKDKALTEFITGKKTVNNKVSHQHQHDQQQQQLQPPSLAPLTLDHKKRQEQQSILGKRPLSRMEDYLVPPVRYRPQKFGEELEDEEEEESEDDEIREEPGEETSEEEGPVHIDDDSEVEEKEIPQKKSATPECVSLDDSDEEKEEKKVEKEEEEEKPVVKVKRIPTGRDTLMRYRTTTIHFDDMKGLFFDEMANDTVVDMYMMLIKDERIKQEIRDKVHIFSCFFFKRLTEGMTSGTNYRGGDKAAAFRFSSVERNFAAISKWTRKIDLFKMDYIIMPVVEDLHWYVIIVVKPSRCIVPVNGKEMEKENMRARRKGFKKESGPSTYAIVLDSLYDANDTKRQCCVDIIRDYLEMEYKSKKGPSANGMVFDRSRIDILRPKELPQQKNFLDCGFFVLKYCETFLSEPPSEEMMRPGVRWIEWYEGFDITIKYMRELVYRTIQSRTDREVWKDYRRFEDSKRDDWDSARRRKEHMHYAKRRRCMSVETVDRRERMTRVHSEPPTYSIPMQCHFH